MISLSVTRSGYSSFASRKPFIKSFLPLNWARFCTRSTNRSTQKPAAAEKLGNLVAIYGFFANHLSRAGIWPTYIESASGTCPNIEP